MKSEVITAPDAAPEGAPNPARAAADHSIAADGWSPYPGLRPFQPDDSEYFYGRDMQVDEVVARLRDKRFVAVIGGSGSGKSSLVLAGAIPRLRTFAIKAAGDFWVPVIATPGTNHVEGDGPIRRLARKFCAELVEAPGSSTRIEACAAILRRPNGLGELVAQFGQQLRGFEGVDLGQTQVNFLFLLDQFEELFHPSNAREPIAGDCKHLVDRIVEQFKQPHPQVCIALTMRSEHLNDCPRYEALPDAINAASYLVKRLDAGQLADAIEQPVTRYLRKFVAEERAARRRARLEGREVPPAVPVPEQIPIDAALIARLIADSKAVLLQQDHADHLPLLQHLLFWIWHEASERSEGHSLLDAITLDDLWRAVGPMPGTPVQPLDASVNTLQACLENRCEAIFCGHVGEQELWEQAFRSLAFKEPNTGSYTQQRVSMHDLRLRLAIQSGDDGSVSGNTALARHLGPWLQPHGYLHWDADSRTVKVAHETLIRRWPRLRKWIDDEDRQFHVYLRLLEDCESWARAMKSPWALSGGDLLNRYVDARLAEALADPVRTARLARLLAMDRDGARLAVVAGDALRFLEDSLAARAEREERRKREDAQLAQAQRDADVERAKNAELAAQNEAGEARNATLREKSQRERLRLYLVVTLVFALLPLMGWVWALARAERLVADKERTLHRSYALAAESQVGFQPQFKDTQGPQGLLRYALIGAQFFERGRQMTTGPAHSWLFRDYYAERIDALRNTERFSEARNTASLRTLLQGAVWAVPEAAAGPASGAPGGGAQPCSTVRLEAGQGEPIDKVATFYPRSGGADPKAPGLIVAVSSYEAGSPTAARSISVGHAEGGRCVIGQQLLASPPGQRVRVGIAGDAANIVIAFDTYTQFYTVMWDDPAGAYSRPRATVSQALGFPEGALPTRPSRFWADVAVGDGMVRLFDVEPSAIGETVADQGRAMTRLAGAAAGTADSPCRAFARSHRIDPATEDVWELAAAGSEGRSHCVRVSSLTNGYGTTLYAASLYALGNSSATAEDNDRDLPLINQLPLGNVRPTALRLDERAGWLAMRGDGGPWRAVPWSLGAFGDMARAVFKPQPAPADDGAASGTSTAAKRQRCGRSNDDPQFDLPYNLILGDMACPSDASLKQAPAAARP